MLQGLFRQALDRAVVLRGVLPKERVRQQWDIAPANAQRRHVELNDLEPVEQIFAEPTVLYALIQVAVRRCHDPDIDFERFVAADPLELPLLKEA